jgi:hypothetical protein
LVEQDQLDEFNKPDEPDRRFTHKRSGSAIAAEARMNYAGDFVTLHACFSEALGFIVPAH